LEHINEACAFYALEADERLVARFLRAIDEAAEQIAAFPQSCRVFHRSTRRVLLETFPYWIYYRVADGGIEIFAVLHAKRGPEFLRRQSK